METLNIEQAAAAIGFSKMTLRRVMKSDPNFPRPVKIGLRRVAWIKSELDAWLMSRPRA
jgi:predicted DNA-binding transcriptional regulator AlpA